ncbi:ATP-dependent helicase [Mesobacillus sp. S13]|uniref:ATP-dependent helicase n=1 Tax=Mesobacillus sp. S13 TaxID=2880221 RepID=UPI001CF36F31|nr:ATP-dependent helicase [Mesobacillus sp. S13]
MDTNLTFQPPTTPIAKIARNVTSQRIVTPRDPDAYYFRSLEKIGIYLNEKQIEAVRTTDGPVLTLAGAGSGKTAVLTARAGYLMLVKNVKPQQILIVTFTKKAATEMAERISKIPGITSEMMGNLLVGTFHSIFLRLLRSVGYTHKIINNEKHRQFIIKKILKDMNINDEPEILLAKFNYMANHLILPKTVKANALVDQEVQEAFQRFMDYKEENNLMDFDDILFHTYQLLEKQPPILKNLQRRFTYIEIDEYQDTSVLQHVIMKKLALPQNNLFVVGDDSQSIYQFRAATNDIILGFPQEYSACRKIVLDINYRSNPYIVGLGNEIIKHNKKRFEKNLYAVNETGKEPVYSTYETVEDEARHIIHSLKRSDREWRDHAILFRTHAVSREITDRLVLEEIPFVTYGKDELFYDNPIVKPILDYLRLSCDPGHWPAFRGILPSLYLSADRVIDYIGMNQKPGDLLLEKITDLPWISSNHREILTEKVAFIKQLREQQPVAAIQEIRNGKGQYTRYLLDRTTPASTLYEEIVEETLDELENSARNFSSVKEYLQFIDQVMTYHEQMEKLRKQKNPNVVKLMTIHGSKGLEFPVVYLIGASESILPHQSSLHETDDRISILSGEDKINEAIEEERRLMYVAVTRAKEELHISSLQTYRNKTIGISRFILEVFEA